MGQKNVKLYGITFALVSVFINSVRNVNVSVYAYNLFLFYFKTQRDVLYQNYYQEGETATKFSRESGTDAG